MAGSGAVHVVNTAQPRASPASPDDVVVEVSARVGSGRVTLCRSDPLRPDIDALIRTVKDFELLTVEAAVHGDEDAALRALVTNPIGPPMSQAPAVWQRLQRGACRMAGAAGMSGAPPWSSVSTAAGRRPTSWWPIWHGTELAPGPRPGAATTNRSVRRRWQR